MVLKTVITLDLIKSYMLNRKQYVFYNDNPSDIRSITCDVPDLTHYYFWYMNGLPNVSDMFADDISMFVNGADLNNMKP